MRKILDTTIASASFPANSRAIDHTAQWVRIRMMVDAKIDDDPLFSGGVQLLQERVFGRAFKFWHQRPFFFDGKSDARGQLTSANEIEAKLARESAPAFDNPGRLFAFARRASRACEGISPAQNVTGRSHMRQMELSLGLRGLEHRASR